MPFLDWYVLFWNRYWDNNFVSGHNSIFVETDTLFFKDFLMNKIEIMGNIVLTVTFDEFNGSLLNKNINFFQQTK